MTELTTLAFGNGIVFKFSDAVKRGMFTIYSETGLIIPPSTSDSTDNMRQAIVYSVGPDVKSEINVGDTILIDTLRWTEGFDVNEDKLWKTDENSIVAVLEPESN